jgi:hypothetical protein
MNAQQFRMLDDDGDGERLRGVRGEEAELELIHALDVLTAALNEIRTRPGHRLGGLVRWALPKVTTEHARIADGLALRRSR